MHYENLKALLKEKGYSLTSPRKQIFGLLMAGPPQTIQELVRAAHDHVDRATIYRTIELFEELGIIHKLNIGWKYKIELSDVFLGHHHHFYCSSCGKSYDLAPNSMLETMIDSLTTKDGFAPRGHQLEIYGLCDNCQGA